jgi:Flp pilus assembly protein TadB
MALQNLKQNISKEKDMLRELASFMSLREIKQGKDREIVENTITSLTSMIKIINNSIPSLLSNISPVPSLAENQDAKDLITVSLPKGNTREIVTINKSDRDSFFDDLNLSTASINRIKRQTKIQAIAFQDFKKPSMFAKISNRFFSKLSNNLVEKGYFRSLNVDLRKGNMPFILNTYVSMMFFAAALSLTLSLALFIVLLFFKLTVAFPFFLPAPITPDRLMLNFVVSLIIPAVVFLLVYIYPSSEKDAAKKRINQELPFVTMHMSAIAGSGIEPSQIFKIIAIGKEYPATKQEMKKVINQVNVYGYDLVNALKNSAMSTSSPKLAELFNGLATTISSGGSLTEFLDKRTESLLFDYKLERERATKMAETFMDLYISIVIAAPMVLMLLLVLMSVSNIGIGLTLPVLTILIVGGVAGINLVFLFLLRMRQTSY